MKNRIFIPSLTLLLLNCGQQTSQSDVKLSSTSIIIAAQKVPISPKIFSPVSPIERYRLISASLIFTCRKKHIWKYLDEPWRFTRDIACDLLEMVDASGIKTDTQKSHYDSLQLPLVIDANLKNINIPDLSLSFSTKFFDPDGTIACIYLHLNYEALGEATSDTMMIRGVHCNRQLNAKNKPIWINEYILGIAPFLWEKPTGSKTTQLLPKQVPVSKFLDNDEEIFDLEER